ncbi:MAG: arylamine N-acetyltransferase [Anaerolineales bacterium]
MPNIINIKTYLNRIHYQGEVKPDFITLTQLQLAHLRSVPFENLSIHYKQPIVLDENLLFEKIVEKKRGGFCYELNGLFSVLLQEIGFNVTKLSAGVAKSDGTFGAEFDHLTLLVHLKEDYLVDVGFGDSFQQPLLFKETVEQKQGEKSYQILRDGEAFILMEKDNLDEKSKFQPQYRFTLQPHELAEYSEMCQYHQISPQSSFTKKRICSRATPNGRISLSELKLILTESNERRETELKSEDEFLKILREFFEIEL